MTKILVVDDEPLDRELVRRSLQQLPGLEFIEAQDGEEGLALVAGHAPDLVLTDLRMPRLDGLELVRRLREEHPEAISILLTSQGSEKIAVDALRAGAMSYVPKSEARAALAETVSEALDLVAARRARGRLLHYLTSSETRFVLENDPALIAPLASHFQESLERLGCGDASLRTQVRVALGEALANSMIHGNLEVSSALRQQGQAAYREEIERRRATSPYAERRLRFAARQSRDGIEYTIEDEGPGFDPSRLPDPTEPENLLKLSGRGVLLIRTFMDQVAYENGGSRVVLRKALPAG
jgi:DNA-binding NarL/FixJ family response regulator